MALNFLFKHKYVDEKTNAWIYFYYMQWHTQFFEEQGLYVKPQESEIDLVQWLEMEDIKRRIRNRSKITPDSVEIFEQFVAWLEAQRD
mmetsp:Transcript_7037/g.11838  ORF Transcript_7037/g.11838 Transcript_7037/m.11838 type:complete len:88 (+) Transcript_7037:539-802(+)